MKRTHRGLARLLSAGMSLALLTSLVPGAMAASRNVEYEVDADEVLYLEKEDFDKFVYDETSQGTEVDELWFTSLPSSSKGVLYFDYDGRDEYEVEKRESFTRRDLDDLAFVPDEDYDGSVTIGFSGESDQGENFSGTLYIEVNGTGRSSSDGEVTYEVDVNDAVDLDVDDFDDYAYDESDGTEVDYIFFTDLPSSSKGTLYYDYGYSSEREVEKDEEFDRDEIDDLTFVPKRNFEGAVTIPFEGRADDGDKFAGELVIRVGDAGGADITVELQAGNGSTVNFQTDAFNEACVKETGANLNYVIFDYDSGRGGYLYYQHGESGESEVGSGRYYRASSPRLDQVSFVPGSGTGSSVRIPFEGEATNGKSFYGEVKLTYVTLSEPTIITYTSTGLAVDFNAADFTAACAARGGKALTSVRFPAPDTTGGQLYYNFHTPTQYRGEVVSTVDYSVGGVYLLGEVTFLPKAGYSGVVTIPYVGTDADGIEYTGTVQVMVTPSASSRFSDMGSYNSWAGASVEFLAAYGITTGTGDGATFSPASTLTRGDYILMLYRTFGFSSTAAAGNFTDVAAGSYYAEALAHAKALGIATAEADGSFRPNDPVTRQDAMVFLLRAMQAVNRSVPNAYDSYLSRFPDGASVADYARTAMAAMAQAGVIQGNEQGKLNPTGTLNRAEMAVILHRALTL